MAEGMADQVDIVIIKKQGLGDPDVSLFTEVADTLRFAFQRLGVGAEVAYNRFRRSRPTILFGGHDLTAEECGALPASTVVYNLEQIDSSRPVGHYMDLLRRCRVWDYSRRNVADLARLGIAARYVPIGHVDEMMRVPTLAAPTTDVLFYGAMNARRRTILDGLCRAGLTVVSLEHYYGPLRDRFIADAKLVLNMHYYEAGIFEIVRVSHLLTNRRAVLAERNPDTEIESDLLDAVAFAPYDRLVETACALVADDGRRAALGENGWRRIRARDAVGIMRWAARDLGLPSPPSVGAL